jgi:hypothetical protein
LESYQLHPSRHTTTILHNDRVHQQISQQKTGLAQMNHAPPGVEGTARDDEVEHQTTGTHRSISESKRSSFSMRFGDIHAKTVTISTGNHKMNRKTHIGPVYLQPLENARDDTCLKHR